MIVNTVCGCYLPPVWMKNTHLYVYSYPEISDKLQKQETVIKNWYQAGKQMDRHPPTHPPTETCPPPPTHTTCTHTQPPKKDRHPPTHRNMPPPPPPNTHTTCTPPPPPQKKKRQTPTHPHIHKHPPLPHHTHKTLPPPPPKKKKKLKKNQQQQNLYALTQYT